LSNAINSKKEDFLIHAARKKVLVVEQFDADKLSPSDFSAVEASLYGAPLLSLQY
jgi:hypothetical protein